MYALGAYVSNQICANTLVISNIKIAEEHYDAIVMNEYRTIRAHSVHLDLPKPKKSRANVKNEHGTFMIIRHTRTTALKDSADKNTLTSGN